MVLVVFVDAGNAKAPGENNSFGIAPLSDRFRQDNQSECCRRVMAKGLFCNVKLAAHGLHTRQSAKLEENKMAGIVKINKIIHEKADNSLLKQTFKA